MSDAYSQFILGTAQLGLPYGHGARRDDLMLESEAYRILDIACDGGFNTIDTSPEYGCAESRVAKYLHENSDKGFHVISKIKNITNSGTSIKETANNWFYKNPFSLLDNCLSLSVLLHTECDLNNLEIQETLEKAKREGQITRWGVSLYSDKTAFNTLAIPGCEIVQVPYGYLNQQLNVSGVLGKIWAKKKFVHARSIFNRGLFFSSIDELADYGEETVELICQLRAFLAENNVSAVKFALQFVLAQSFVNSVIAGFDSSDQIEDFVLASQDLQPLDVPNELLAQARKLRFSY